MPDNMSDAQSSELLRCAFRLSPVSTAAVSGDGRLLLYNEAFCRMSGHTDKQLTGAFFVHFIHPEDQDVYKAALSSLQSQDCTDGTCEVRFAKNHDRYIWSRLTIIKLKPCPPSGVPASSDDQVFLIQVQDISGRREAKLAAEATKLQLAAILENMTDGYFTIDAMNRFTFVNKAAEAILHCPRSLMLGRAIEEIFPDTKRSPLRFIFELLHESYPEFIESYYEEEDRWFEILVTRFTDSCGIYIRDITEKKRTEEALKESERMYRMIADRSSDMIARIDMYGKFQYVSPASRTMFGFSPEELAGRPIQSFIHPEDLDEIRACLEKLRSDSDTLLPYFRAQRSDGSYVWLETTAKKMISPSGRRREILTVTRDITVRKKAEEELLETNAFLQKISSIDALTGVANRRLFDDRYEKEWRNAARYRTPLTVIIIDIDDFKKYNDTYGHTEGDRCLQLAAEALRASIKRPGDFIARFGGEEFVVLLPMTDLDGARFVAEKLRMAVENLQIPHGKSSNASIVTASAGAAVFSPSHSLSPRELLIRADQALYQAKATGRNRTQVYCEAEAPLPRHQFQS